MGAGWLTHLAYVERGILNKGVFCTMSMVWVVPTFMITSCATQNTNHLCMSSHYTAYLFSINITWNCHMLGVSLLLQCCGLDIDVNGLNCRWACCRYSRAAPEWEAFAHCGALAACWAGDTPQGGAVSTAVCTSFRQPSHGFLPLINILQGVRYDVSLGSVAGMLYWMISFSFRLYQCF